MNKLFFIIAAIVLIAAAIFGLRYFPQQPNLEPIKNSEVSEPLGEYLPGPNGWVTYKSNNLGFKIDLPPDVIAYYDDRFEGYRRHKYVPVRVFEKKGSNTIYVANESPVTSGPITYDLVEYDDKNYIPIEVYSISADIKEVGSIAELDRFLKDTYGEECAVSSSDLVPDDDYSGNYRFSPNDSESAKAKGEYCAILASCSYIYSPTYKKAAIGFCEQDLIFTNNPSDAPDYEIYDLKIRGSFRFYE